MFSEVLSGFENANSSSDYNCEHKIIDMLSNETTMADLSGNPGVLLLTEQVCVPKMAAQQRQRPQLSSTDCKIAHNQSIQARPDPIFEPSEACFCEIMKYPFHAPTLYMRQSGRLVPNNIQSKFAIMAQKPGTGMKD